MDNTMGERLKKLRKENGWTLQDVAIKLGLKGHSTYSNWEYDRREPDSEMLAKLAALYDVSTDYLLTGSESYRNSYYTHGKEIKALRRIKNMSISELSKRTGYQEETLQQLENGVWEWGTEGIEEIVRNLGAYYSPSNGRIFFLESVSDGHYVEKSILEYIAENIEDEYNIKNREVISIPVLGHISAGKPILATEHIEEWTDIPNMWNLKDGEVFMLRVKGDSMVGSRIYEGDRVVVKIQPEVESGEIAVVNVDGEDATLKRVKKINGKVVLYPDNPRYEPIFIDNEKARIVGKVIQVMFEPKRM